jgi:hypothetical protein
MTEVTEKKVHVSILSVDMTECKSKIKIMSYDYCQEKKKCYYSARNNASPDSFYMITEH